MNFKSTITIQLETGDSAATVEITKLKLNERNEFIARFKLEQSEAVKELNNKILQNIKSVTGLYLDGFALTVNDIKGGDVPADITDAIIAAYFAAMFPKEAEEKNVSKAA